MGFDVWCLWHRGRSWLHLFLVFWNLVDFGISHPQCLDFRAPFNPGTLDFCTDYSTFGCCTKAADQKISDKYNSILQTIRTRTDVTLTCRDFVKTILCLECSPYAAHLYEAEATRVIKPFPSLCSDTVPNRYNSTINSYCQSFYSNCSYEIIKYMTDDEETLKSAVTQGTFCKGLANQDVDYCYPGVLVNTTLNAELQSAQSSKEGCVCLEEYGSGLRKPVFARPANDGTNMLYVGEQGGLIYVYKNKQKIKKPFLDIVNKVTTSSSISEERGLLGMAFHPNFTDNGKFYVHYSMSLMDPSVDMSKISEFTVLKDNKFEANLSSERQILAVQQPYWNHNGGELLFGEDGFLYVFFGDGGSAGDPMNLSQNTSSFLGKVLRLDVDTAEYSDKNYKVPLDNPFVKDADFLPEIYAYGFRNPWRCSKDRGDPDKKGDPDKGRIICGDVGQSKFEEIDLIKKGGNYGWNGREGMECYNDKICGKMDPEELPIFTYPHSIGKSVIGGYVYRGCQNPKLKGSYIFGDYVASKFFRLKENKSTGKWENGVITTCAADVCINGLTSTYPPHVVSFGEDEYGEIFVLSVDMGKAIAGIHDSGKLHRIVDPNQRGNPATCKPAGPFVKPKDDDGGEKSTSSPTKPNTIGASGRASPVVEVTLLAVISSVILLQTTS